MTRTNENQEPCIERCGVSAHRGRTCPIDPITAGQYLDKAGVFTKDGDVDYDKLEPFADDAADCLYSGCVVIRNKFIEAAKHHDYKEMYRLLAASYTNPIQAPANLPSLYWVRSRRFGKHTGLSNSACICLFSFLSRSMIVHF